MMRLKLLVVITVVAVLVCAFAVACGSEETTTTTGGGGTASTASAPSSTIQPQETLKIGAVLALGASSGVDQLNALELQAEVQNNNGGLTVGDKTYKIEVISYDTNGDQNEAVAAINRLVYEDEVKFIVFDAPSVASAWLNITESNKVITLGASPDMANLMPNITYSFNPSTMNTSLPATIGWFCKNYPDAVKGGVVGAMPDNMMGQMFAGLHGQIWTAFGVTYTPVFYPPDATDLSAVATKVNTMNPGVFTTGGGGVTAEAALYKSVRAAGYAGMFLGLGSGTAETYVGIAGADVMEGYVNIMDATEPDPPLTPAAQEYKDAWIAKFGKWETPDMIGASFYPALATALQTAGTLDADAVANVLAGGLQFESPRGTGQMVSRPDLGNTRTVDGVCSFYVKEIRDGKPVQVASIGLDEIMSYIQQVWGN